MPNDLDIYFHDFASLDCDAFLQEYFDQVLEMEAHGGFDVLAHIDYPLRVMKHGDYVPSLRPVYGPGRAGAARLHRPRLCA